MKQIRKRLTYANVMSSLAVFLVLGGATAFAATQLAKNSVGTNAAESQRGRPRRRSRRTRSPGARSGEWTLGTVPGAGSVDGQSFLSFHNEMAGDAAALTLFDFGGVKFKATCPGGVPNIDATNTSGIRAAARSALITEAGNVFGNGQTSFSTFQITNKEKAGGGTVEAIFEDGKVTSVSVAYRSDTFSAVGCRLLWPRHRRLTDSRSTSDVDKHPSALKGSEQEPILYPNLGREPLATEENLLEADSQSFHRTPTSSRRSRCSWCSAAPPPSPLEDRRQPAEGQLGPHRQDQKGSRDHRQDQEQRGQRRQGHRGLARRARCRAPPSRPAPKTRRRGSTRK